MTLFFTSGMTFSCTKPTQQTKHVLRMNICREPATLDPRKGSELVSSTLHFILFEGLVRLEPDGTLIPAQAKTISISDDRKTYTFHLRGTYWSDGTPVTAKDFEYAWKKILSPNFPAPNAPLLYPIKNSENAKKGIVPIDDVGIWTVDNQTLVVELERPTPYFLDLISFCVFFPVNHVVDKKNHDWMYEAGPLFTSNGPFKLTKWKHHNEIVVEKNPYYWEADQIDLNKMKISMITNENTALEMYENNQLDLIGLGYSPLPCDSLADHREHLKSQAVAKTTIICFNVEKYPFNNINIRKAFAYAINRKEIVENITQMRETIATTLIPPPLQTLHTKPYFQDNDSVNALACFELGLKELGISKSDFPIITYQYSYSELNYKLAQTLQQQWSQLFGIQVQLERSEHKLFIDRLGNRNYEIAQSFWFAQYHDPMSIYERYKYKSNSQNYPGWENADYIRFLEQSALQSDPEKRLKILQAAEEILFDEMPLVPVYHCKDTFMIKDHLAYEPFAPTGSFELTRISFK